jgi:hypothetical protein
MLPPRTAALGLVLLASCSSSSSSGPGSAPHDGGTDGTTAEGGGSGGDAQSADGSDAHSQPPDCGVAPKLPVEDAGADAADAGAAVPGSIFCASSTGGALVCPTGEECCIGGTKGGAPQPAECAVFGATCINGTGDAGPAAASVVQCNDVSDCTANGLPGAPACCLRGSQSELGCTYPLFVGGGDVVCEGEGDAGPPADGGITACLPGELQVCQGNADCAAGKKCVAASWIGRAIGVCQ